MNTMPRTRIVGLAVVILLLVAAGLWYWLRPTLDNHSFAVGNGRIEATELYVSAKAAGRVADILVNEGDFVSEGQVIARMDMKSLEAQLAQAQAQVANAISTRESAKALVAQRQADVARAQAQLVQSQSELDLARKTSARSQKLVQNHAISEQEADDHQAQLRVSQASINVARAQIVAAEAGVKAAQAQVAQAEAAIKAAQAVVERLRTELDDGVLRAPRAGRVQYRIVQPGEVVANGGKVVSLVDISDVYMSFFLPETVVGRVALGSEVRIILDAAPQWAIPARISYVASVAQFTPKTVETESERQKLVFHVKARIDPELLQQYPEQVKTGLPGVAHVRLDPDVPWPDLEARLL